MENEVVTEEVAPEPVDLSLYNDKHLDALRVQVLNEKERRQRMAAIPAAIADLVTRYEADGGNKADITI